MPPNVRLPGSYSPLRSPSLALFSRKFSRNYHKNWLVFTVKFSFVYRKILLRFSKFCSMRWDFTR
jgi:hypothetical protein